MNKSKKPTPPEQIQPKQLAIDFENYFCGKVCAIRDGMSCDFEVQRDDLNGILFDKFKVVSDDDLMNVLKSVKMKYSAVDEIPQKAIQPVINAAFKTILEIINDSLQSGIFPESLKKSFVTPIPKSVKVDFNNLSTFRPIFSIPIMSKIIEKCVHSQINEHLINNKLLISNQSAYRSNHGCETALLKVVNDAYMLLDSSTSVMVSFLDFSAAFDTINHELLLQKLEFKYGIKGTALMWFESFLKSRMFQVKIKDSVSNRKYLNFGVPQGSVLGPILFCLYVQEIGDIISRHSLRFYIFADNVQIYL